MRVITENDESAFEELDRAECLQLLGWEALGRLAISVPDHGPEIVPVNFVLDGDSVVFRCAPARAAKLTGRRASFEIDRVDPHHRLGWSVVVSGTAVQLLFLGALAAVPVLLERPGLRRHIRGSGSDDEAGGPTGSATAGRHSDLGDVNSAAREQP